MTGNISRRFRADTGWLSYHAAPRRPQFHPPAGAVDAHCHVFGPGEEFPYARERKYTPTDSPRRSCSSCAISWDSSAT